MAIMGKRATILGENTRKNSGRKKAGDGLLNALCWVAILE